MIEFVLVRRELLDRLVNADYSYGALGTPNYGYPALDELRSVLAQEAGPVVERQEPICQWSDDDGISWCDGNDRSLQSARESGWKTRTLYASPPAPVAVVLPRKFLIGYRTPSGFGRFFNDRQDGSVPSEENIVSMESKLEAQHGVQCTILQVTEISACLDKVKELNQ